MKRESTYREDKRATGLKAAVFYTHLSLAEQKLDKSTVFDKIQRDVVSFGFFGALF